MEYSLKNYKQHYHLAAGKWLWDRIILPVFVRTAKLKTNMFQHDTLVVSTFASHLQGSIPDSAVYVWSSLGVSSRFFSFFPQSKDMHRHL